MGAAWLPFVLLASIHLLNALLRQERQSSFRMEMAGYVKWIFMLSMILALQYLAGYPQQLIFSIIIVVSYGCVRSVSAGSLVLFGKSLCHCNSIIFEILIR